MLQSLNKSLIILFISLYGLASYAQESFYKTDIKHIYSQLSIKQPDPFKRPYIYRGEPSIIKKINPVGLLFGGSLFVYQNILSKHISADCLFTPSCSEFSKQALREDGLLIGTLMTIDRVNRCNRIAAQDLKRYSIDAKTSRYPDPVLRYRKVSKHNAE